MCILLVEDDAESRLYIGRLLRKLGYKVVEAGGGREALDILENSEISLVFSDVFLPEISGVEIMKRLKRKKRNKSVRFIFYSGFVDEQLKKEALREGALGYFYKPVNIAQVLDLVYSISMDDGQGGDSNGEGVDC